VWQRKMWETSLWICSPLSKTIVTIISQSILWVVIRSLPQRHRSKWVHKSIMVWPH
jgi:hypothetical protein